MIILVSVRLFLSVCTTRPIFTNFCARYLWPWLSPPLVALRYVMCCVSGFVNDVMSADNTKGQASRRREKGVGLLFKRLTEDRTGLRVESDLYNYRGYFVRLLQHHFLETLRSAECVL